MLKGKIGSFKGFLFDESSITVYSAIIATPIALGFASRIPNTTLPAWLFLLVISLVLFVLSSSLGMAFRPIVKGMALGVFVNALFATSFGSQLSARIANITARASG